MLKRLNWRTIVSGLVMLLFISIIVIQGFYVWTNYAYIQLGIIKRYIRISSIERSTILIFKSDPASYLRFLNLYIPTDSSVVLPPETQVGDLQRQKWFSDQNMMQFYLFPRTILLCDQEINSDCLNYLSEPDTFVLAFGEFPPAEYMVNKVFISFPETVENIKGLYVPIQAAEQLVVPTQEAYTTRPLISLSAPLIDAAIILSLMVLGYLYVTLIVSNPTWLTILSLSFPLSIGLLSWTTFITSFLGVPITLFTMTLWLGSLMVVGAALHILLRKSLPALPPIKLLGSFKQTWKESPIALCLSLAVFLWFGLSGIISLGHGYSSFDEIANWCLKGYAMAFQHSIWASSQWGGHIMAYPMNMQLSITFFRLADGDVLPGSKAIFPMLTMSLLIGCYRFWRGLGVNAKFAWMGVLLIFTAPFYFRYTTQGYANGPFTAYIVLGILWSIEGLLKKETRPVFLGGLLLAFAGWTRPEGIGYSLIVFLVVYLGVKFLLKINVSFRQIISSLLPIVVFPFSWLLLVGAKNMRQDQIGSALNFFGEILRGNLNINPLGVIASYAQRYFTWWQDAGYVVLLSIVILIILLPISKWFKSRIQLFLFLVAIMTALIPAALFYVDSFSESDFTLFLEVSFDRAYLPAIVLLIISSLFVLNSFLEPRQVDGVTSQELGEDDPSVRYSKKAP